MRLAARILNPLAHMPPRVIELASAARSTFAAPHTAAAPAAAKKARPSIPIHGRPLKDGKSRAAIMQVTIISTYRKQATADPEETQPGAGERQTAGASSVDDPTP
jgi:carbohydrate-binding DOMON domain-containing protein